MAPTKGKQGTKGQMQIFEENVDTLKFYEYMILGANATYLAVTLLLFDLFNVFNIVSTVFVTLFTSLLVGSISVFHQFMLLMTSVSYIGSYLFMAFIFVCGINLNLTGGVASHVKDMIILTAGTQVLSLISNYFWFLMLLAPSRGFYFLWTKLLAPYFFQPSPVQEVDEKKQKKLERKMRRH